MKTTSRLNHFIRQLVFSAVCLALCMVLPFLTGQIPQIGKMLCPMHYPILLAGFLCGPWWAMVVGFIAPMLRYVLFGMPAILPTGLAMCFELMAYALSAGVLYRLLPKKRINIYSALIVSMLIGRIVWGAVSIVIYSALSEPFTWGIFFAGAFVNAIPGIIVQLLVIPALVMALQKARLITD